MLMRPRLKPDTTRSRPRPKKIARANSEAEARDAVLTINF